LPSEGRIHKFLVELVLFRAKLRNDPTFDAIPPEERQSIASQLSQLIAKMDWLRRQSRPSSHRLNPRSAGDYFPCLEEPDSPDHSQ
jgi:hypothetical protein